MSTPVKTPRFQLAERIKRTYQVIQSTRKVAELLGISHDSVLRSLHDQGVEVKRQSQQTLARAKTRPLARRYSRIAVWLERHKDRRLPRSYAKLSQVSGATVDSIKCFLYRRRKKLMKVLEELPSLRDKRIVLVTTEDVKVRGDEVLSYEWHIDRFSLEVSLVIRLKGGETCLCDIPYLQDFRTALLTALQRQPSSGVAETRKRE